MGHDVFLSYASADARLAQAVCEALESKGVACWIAPRDVTPGAVFDEAIVDAIDAARATVLILSANTDGSPFVKTEINRAFSRRHTIFTVRAADVSPSRSLELYLARHHWVDAFPPPIHGSLDRLATAVRAVTGVSRAKRVPGSEPRGPEVAAAALHPSHVAAPPTTRSTTKRKAHPGEQYSGRVIFADGRSASFTYLYSTSYGDAMPYSSDATQLQGSTFDLPRLRFGGIARIDLLEAPPEAASVATSRGVKTVRFATITFRDGTTMSDVFIDTSSLEWRGMNQSGGLNSNAVVALLLDAPG